ncbi:DUF3405 domain protein [Metarhizium robertsii]|uniref:DUF3405 domain protein n=2 Tax=Metarhizium robertsii TaxID=568076 RepID=A0A014PBQ1_9HYPO|nr:DUF3405 domain protein [Metarhizium robertsii]
MLNPQGRRTMLSRLRPRSVFIIIMAALSLYFLVFSGPSPRLHIVPYTKGGNTVKQGSAKDTKNNQHDEKPLSSPRPEDVALKPDPGHHHEEPTGTRAGWEIDIDDLTYWSDPDDPETNDDVLPGYETDGTHREAGDVARLQHEKDLRKMWRYAYKTTAKLANSNLVYGNTLNQLIQKDNRTEEQSKCLREDPNVKFKFNDDQPVRFNPYPDYNGDEWKKNGHGPYVPCKGPTGEFVEDLLVFRGRPARWPQTKFGGYDLFGIDPNLCWERDSRLGQYGLQEMKKKVGGSYKPIDWDNVNWGELQKHCLKQNAARFDMTMSKKNPYLNNYTENHQKATRSEYIKTEAPKIKGRSIGAKQGQITKEFRTALLLRSYTGMKYTDNDRQVIRALVSELSLKTGGQYEVFLLVHSKNQSLPIFDDDELYQTVLKENVPAEFHGMTVLWSDHQVWDVYPALTDEYARAVHSAQWLSVQKFSQDHPQFDHIWNWEMDFRYTGHHYDLLEKLSAFAKKQPRKYLWERNERYYIPEYHGDYDTSFREDVAKKRGNKTVWGPPNLPFVKPVGPKPPVASHEEDNYEWGVGEEADFISVGPIFDPVDSQWIISNHVWGYSDENHKSTDLPRRTTIVTQSRISKRLLDIMHVENLRGQHVASEMTAQTVALLHGLKTVFAPHPVFMDRDWKGGFLNNWFNPGPDGESGGRGSPFGWGRERRFQGTTWYYRAEPPNRLYNNWMGWVDTNIGGIDWEKKHGRPCLPSVMLHPIKNTQPTKPGHKSEFELAIG